MLVTTKQIQVETQEGLQLQGKPRTSLGKAAQSTEPGSKDGHPLPLDFPRLINIESSGYSFKE